MSAVVFGVGVFEGLLPGTEIALRTIAATPHHSASIVIFEAALEHSKKLLVVEFPRGQVHSA
jgi:hypothetical protein